MSIEFYNTGYGKDFFQKQLPSLIKGITRLADATEKANILKEKEIELMERKNTQSDTDESDCYEDFGELYQNICEIKKLYLKLEYAFLAHQTPFDDCKKLDSMSDCSNINSLKELHSKVDTILNHANECMLSCKDTFDDTDEYYNIVECVDYSEYTDLKYGSKLYNEIENPICVTNLIKKLSELYGLSEGNYVVLLHDLGEYIINFNDIDKRDAFLLKYSELLSETCFNS